MFDLPKVSIVIVNMNGKHHLPACFKSITRLDYPKDKIEVIVVDNGSSDGSVQLIQASYKWVKLIQNTRNEGFAKPSNDGARAATSPFVAFINNDMRVQRDWLKELVSSMINNNAQCAGSVILNWNGKEIDFCGGSVNFYGLGYQDDFKKPVSLLKEKYNEDSELLFACGGAMLIDRKIFLDAGGFDEDYFAYYEDVDLGWRLRVMGYKIVLSVRSMVYHKHNSTSKTITRERVQLLYERNKIYTAYKNYGDKLFHEVFFPSLLLELRELYLFSDIDGYNYDINNSDAFNNAEVTIKQKSAVKICALNDFVQNIAKLDSKRKEIQLKRNASDDDIIKFLTNPFIVFPKDSVEFLNSEYDVVKTFGIDKLLQKDWKTKILIISNDKIGEKMAGTGIRYWEIAKSIAATGKFEVYLACPDECNLQAENIHMVVYTGENHGELLQKARESNIILMMGFVLETMPDLRKILNGKYVIVDIYDPYVIESMEVYKDENISFRNKRHDEAFRNLDYQLKIGDFFICANEKQKDYWIGMLSALNRINPEVYTFARNGGKLVETVPFGISDTAPVHEKNMLKGVWPGINQDDIVLIWGGGIWNWFDPLTLIKAVKIISQTRSNVKLFFMGVKHPNPAVTQMEMLNDAVALAKELDLYDKYVFFNFGWVDYADRQNYLLEADIGVSCHFETLETRFSFRTRILDCLWADLPIICTQGDYFADLIEEKKLGYSVNCEDPDDLAEKITALIDNQHYYQSCKANIKEISEKFKWSVVTKPVVDYCKNPFHLGMNMEEALQKPDNIFEAEEDSTHTAHRGKGGIYGKIDKIQDRQNSIEQLLGKNLRLQKETNEKVSELIEWSYMMNNRLIKLKKLANPFKWLKRLFSRGKK